ncbi:hypothetical protein Tco_0267075 [Tanacetum coccineum]
MPLKPDLSFFGLEEFVNEPIVSEHTAKKPVVETSEAKASAVKPKDVRNNFGPSLIEDWISDSEDEAKSKPKIEKKLFKPRFSRMTHPSPKRNMVPKALLMRSGLISLTTARPINTAQPRTTVNNAKAITSKICGWKGVINRGMLKEHEGKTCLIYDLERMMEDMSPLEVCNPIRKGKSQAEEQSKLVYLQKFLKIIKHVLLVKRESNIELLVSPKQKPVNGNCIELGKEGGDLKKDSEGIDQEKEDNVNNTNTVNAASTNEFNTVGGKTSIDLLDDPNMPTLEDIIYSDDDEDVGAKADMNNLDAFMPIDVKMLFFMGLQVNAKEDGIFISQDKYVTGILKKFGFTDVKTASTPMETQKHLLKDEYGEEVDLYAVPDTKSTLNSPFDLVAYTDSDYAGASLDKKSTTREAEDPTIGIRAQERFGVYGFADFG